MNKKLMGVALLLSTTQAFAQTTGSTVELYGIIDLGIGHVDKSLNVDPNFPASVNPVLPSKATVSKSVTGMFNGGIQDSRWGLRGNEDLGGGMHAFFTLESGINANDGNLNNADAAVANNSPAAKSVSASSALSGQLFSRQAFVGIGDDKYGSLAFGRNYAPICDVFFTYDPVQFATLFSPLGFSGAVGGGGGVSEDSRLDNSVKYTNKMGPVNVTAIYKFGGVAGNSSAESGYGFGIGYEDGGFGVQASYEAMNDALKTSASTVAGEINVTNVDTKAFVVAAKYAFGQATVKGGYESYTLSTPSTPIASLGVTSLFNIPVAVQANFTSATQTTDVLFIGGDYNFTPALNLAVGYYDIEQKQSADMKQLGGNSRYASALLDYHFSKRTDVYAGLMHASYTGAAFPSASYNTSNLITEIGIRTKF